MRVPSLGGYPIEQYDSPNGGGEMSGHRGAVLHIAQGSYRGTIAWQMNPDQQYANGQKVNTCSSWVVGRERGEWAQMRDSDLIAWCQRAGSRTWLSIELAGFAPTPPSDWQIEACAQLLAWSARTYRHPVAVANDPSGYGLGHHSMDREWLGEEWGHEACPGAGVIAAKQAIVLRAKAIAAGEDEEMLPEERAWLYNASRHAGDLAHMSETTASMAPDGKITSHPHEGVLAIKATQAAAQQALDAVHELAARPAADVDEQAIATALAPLLPTRLSGTVTLAPAE